MPDIPNPSVPASAPFPQKPSTEGRPTVAADARVVVRPMPKVIFFYLTWLASLVMGIIASATSGAQPAHLGTVWMCIFAFNLLVIAFDFTEVISIASVFGILVIIFAGLYFGFLGFIGQFFGKLDV